MTLHMLNMLIANPNPSWGHIQHVCHLLATHNYRPCQKMTAGSLRHLGYNPARDQGLSIRFLAWIDVFNGDRVDVVRLLK